MRESIENNPVVALLREQKEILWINSGYDNSLPRELSEEDVADAERRLRRFAPYIKSAFPGEKTNDGVIESPLVEIPAMRASLHPGNTGKLYLKCDNLLPVSGSIKARGGIYEVLYLAEKIAIENGMLSVKDDYSKLNSEEFRKLFSRYSIGVGSTGNLGLSIGIMSAKLGFNVNVHMSSDARQWKKDMLRLKGCQVTEYDGDFMTAVTAGRKQAEGKPNCHFIDDENSKTLLLGYATAAYRLKNQLAENNIPVDAEHPLYVYLPCGVGGGPGGITLGLKYLYGNNVRCFFAEPVQSPCMLLGLATGMHDKISVHDIGLSGKTRADGLAVSRPSKLIGVLLGGLISGIYTLQDEKMEALVKELYKTEEIFVEPSAAAGLPGICLTEAPENATHIAWATGGNMVPAEEREKYIGKSGATL